MIVLGVESSCDETSVAVVRGSKKILSNIVASSLKIHSKHGGVIPEIASRMQLESIASVFNQAVKKAKINCKDIDLVSVTSGPGLPGSLLVGISFAKALALSLGKPVIGVNHIYSHVYANLLCHRNIKLPAVALVVSGGHTSLFYIKDFADFSLLGETLDDACGEAFDKVAKIMGLGYPGGPLIEKLAEGGNRKKIKFACSGMNNEMDFSFSGIKTAVFYYLKGKKIGPGLKKDLAACFQESAVNTLIRKSLVACKHKKSAVLLIGGGVVANGYLRQKIYSKAKEAGVVCYFPDTNLCMDNAAMVAALGSYLYEKGKRSSLNLNIELS
ncbi:MAG: tRNA (adenosine(37)-N6)-threonylcarbamoyltransferase complex transferase subunit TsaD [Candidatus Omnitrophica bacterium]|nr:tRNA (adenosine(37)-N6)-threonylcarbamoyltransferase complex transferase subunit TsaD [Candidatus Omnitrophota bacterium]